MKPNRDVHDHQQSAHEDALCAAFVALENVDECRNFLKDLCTPAELQALVDRWQAIAGEAEAEFLTRYEQAHGAVMQASAAFREARRAEQRESAAIAARKQALLALTAREQNGGGRTKDLSQVLWDMFTGSAPYRDIVTLALFKQSRINPKN